MEYNYLLERAVKVSQPRVFISPEGGWCRVWRTASGPFHLVHNEVFTGTKVWHAYQYDPSGADFWYLCEQRPGNEPRIVLQKPNIDLLVQHLFRASSKSL